MLVETQRVVIVGAGHAGVELAADLRHKGFSGGIDLVSDEAPVPYQRPPLSKDYIKRKGEPLVLRPAKFFTDKQVTFHPGVRANSIDRAARTVRLSSGSVLAYDHLVLATGARNRRPPIPGIDHPEVIELRTLADAKRIVQRIGAWKRVAVVGGGFIGLEAAGLLATMEIAVDVVEAAPRLMQRAVSPTVSAWFRDFHQAHGVQIHMPQQVAAVRHEGTRAVVELTCGDLIDVDAVILAAGVVPNVEIAEAAGLATDNGIVVDAHLATADRAISAIGDCANYPNAQLCVRTRLESVQNATDQARSLATRLMGEPKAYDALPWFWSIQGTARLQIAGLAVPGLREVIRGTPGEGKFSVFLFDGERLQAVESINAAADHMAARRLIAAGGIVCSLAIANLATDLKSLIAG